MITSYEAVTPRAKQLLYHYNNDKLVEPCRAVYQAIEILLR